MRRDGSTLLLELKKVSMHFGLHNLEVAVCFEHSVFTLLVF